MKYAKVENMTNHLTSNNRYEIYAQSPCGKLIIQDIPANIFFMKTAREILADLELLSGFPTQQSAFIGMIADSIADTIVEVVTDIVGGIIEEEKK